MWHSQWKRETKLLCKLLFVNMSVMDTCIQQQAWAYDSFRTLEKLYFLTSAFTLPDGSFFNCFAKHTLVLLNKIYLSLIALEIDASITCVKFSFK